MINIIIISKTIFQMHIIIDGCENIFFCNVLRNQLMDILANRIFQFIDIACCLFQKFSENRIVHQLRHAHFLRVNVNNALQIYHHIRKNFDIAFSLFSCNPYIWDCRVLNCICKFSVNFRSFFRDHLSCQRAYNIFCQNSSVNTITEQKLLIKFITSNFSKIITPCIKEHTCDQAFSTVHSKRFTRTNLLV